jgi:hypothetical protein
MVGGAIERRFPLPTELRPATTLGDQFAPPQVREREQAAADLEKAIAEVVAEVDKASDPIVAIQGWLKKLTHRQMRTLVERIFKTKATDKTASGDTSIISLTQMPDILDHFAHED